MKKYICSLFLLVFVVGFQGFSQEEPPCELTHFPATDETCESAGNKEYWYCEATETYYTDSYGTTPTTLDAQTIAPKGHDYALDSWSWAEDKKTASVKFVCQNDENHTETVDAVVTTDTTHETCTTDGKIVYTAKATFETIEYTATKEVTLEKLGHDYALDSWSWAEDNESASVKFVCQNNENHTETIEAVVTTDTTHETCTTDGKIVYTANAVFEGQTYTATKEVTLEKIGHNYALDSWSWAEDKKSASVKFICQNDENHIETIDAVVTIDTTYATCTADGKIVYIAKATFETIEYTATKEVTLEKLGHDYALDSWSWAEDNESASVRFVCQNNENHIETIDAVVTTDTTYATCTADGKIVYTAKATFETIEYTATKEVTLEKIGHDYALDSWSWAEDKKTASVKFICQNNENHTETVEADVTTDTTHETCTTDGKIVYTANAEFEGENYTATKEVTLEKLGHDYALDSWSWAEDNESASVKFVCQNNENHIETIDAVVTTDTTHATCTTDGKIVYTAKATFETVEYTDTKEVTLEKLDHNYALDTWSWAEDKESASVKFICQNDVNHTETVNADVTTDTTYATCTVDGKIVYTAKATFETVEYTDTKEVALEKLDHNYALDTWSWAEDNESAIVKFICQNDENHTETVDAIVTTDTTHATCTMDGKIVYTANAEFEGQPYTDTKEVTLEKLGHNYALDSCLWSDDKDFASAKFVCQNDANHTETVEAVVTTDTTYATCTTDGKIVYTAKATFETVEYTDTKEVTLPAINHNYALDSWSWAEDKKSANVKFICQNDENHTETIAAVVTTDTTHATCTTDGKIVYTANADFEGEEYTDTKEVTLEKLGHDYAMDSWTWAEDKKSANVKFVCQNDENHTETIVAVVTTDTTYATCTADGKIVYTANAVFEGQTYTDTKEVTLPAINHDYALDSWSWAEDKKSASVKFVCQNDVNHTETVEAVVTIDTTNATCTTDGKIVYTAKATFETVEYTDTKEVTLEKLGHDYALDSWLWAEDKKSANVKFVCQNDVNHTETVAAVVSTDTTHETCTTDGKIVYMAKATFETVDYIDTKEVMLPAINHNYALDSWSWAEDNKSASVKFICQNDENHTETVDAVVTTDTTYATCTTDGKIVYTANATFETVEYTDTKEVTLEKLGHQYVSQGWEWRDDWSGAKIRFVCERDANHIDSVEVTTVIDTITNAGIANPMVLFAVETEFDGQTYSDLKTKTLSAQFSVQYNEAGNDIDGDGISDEFLGAFTKELYGATEYYWDRFWSPTTGDFFLITMTGVANYSGTLQFELVDTLRKVSLGELSSAIHVVAGEEFTAKVPMTVMVMRDSLGNKLKYTVLEYICTPAETSSSPTFTNNACEFEFSDFEIIYESAGTGNYDNPHSLVLVGQDKYEYVYEGVFSTKLAAPTKCSVLNLSITVIPDIPLDFFAFSLVDAETMRSILGEPCIKLENSTMYVPKKEYTYEFTIPIDSLVATAPKLLLRTESPYERQRAIYYIKSLNLSYSEIHTEEIIPELAATCEEPGHSEGVRCSVCGEILTEPTEYPALGHAYVSQGWQWSEDFSEASVDFVCSNDATHTHTEHAQITSKTVPATCTAEGAVIYMAKVMLGEATYQDTKVSVLEIVPHTEMTVEGIQPTCTETGLSDGVQCAVCGAILVEQTELPARGHSLQHEAYVAPTVEEEGIEEHWYCNVCHSIFDSEAATHEISNADVIIPKLEPTGIPSQLSLLKVYSQKNHIVVEQAEGEFMRIFDVNGHCVVSERISTQIASYPISVVGVYVVAVGATVVSVVVQ